MGEKFSFLMTRVTFYMRWKVLLMRALAAKVRISQFPVRQLKAQGVKLLNLESTCKSVRVYDL
jgi:hypothetical protein